jgi:hypothetical protein
MIHFIVINASTKNRRISEHRPREVMMKFNKEVLSFVAAGRFKRGAALRVSQGSAVVKMNATIALCKLYGKLPHLLHFRSYRPS